MTRSVPRNGMALCSRGLVLGGVWLRVTTRWRARELDDQLAGGADPMHSDELSLRAGQLGSSKRRRRIACALRGVVALAERDAYPIAIASKLIDDRRSPLYSEHSDRPLAVSAFEALVAMDRTLRTAGPSDG